jgi:2-polyprenyl-6-hydroxyphenyl methylase / 3-demethylubiquinone-9 3-methyltransferase
MDQRVGAGERTIDTVEVVRFDAADEGWWDASGPARWLHRYNPVRVDYIREHAGRSSGSGVDAERPLQGLRILDIGCGGGVLCEPLATLGADVVGVDPARNAIAAAKRHAAQSGLDIDYRATTAETLAAEGERFDVVAAMEVIEHVADHAAFLGLCAELLRPGGTAVLSTINRTRKSYAYAIVAAEYVLRLLPRGTHDWHRFVTPQEVGTAFAPHGVDVTCVTGVTMNLFQRSMQRSSDVSVNYMLAARKGGARP